MKTMKILIVTVYNSHNSGSFLQAYAMMSVLKEMGHNVQFLKREIKGSSHDIKRVARRFFLYLIKFRFRQACYFVYEWFIYEKAQKHFPIISMDSNYYKETDCIVVGSDTIWNFDSKVLRALAATYLGNAFIGKHVISYAASAANTSIELFQTIIRNNGGLSNIETIMVRDKHTKRLVELSTNKIAYTVTDPTLIVSRSAFNNLRFDVKTKKPYILLYFLGEMKYNLKKEIQVYASVNKYSIISMPIYRKWCDRSLMSSPQNMISYFMSATAVVTDTFHGTAFSLIYEKPFAVHDDGKNKVKELLELYGEGDRLFTSPDKLKSILSNKNVVVSSGKLDAVRNNSIKMLKDALVNYENSAC